LFHLFHWRHLHLKPYAVPAHAQVFKAGEMDADLLVLQSGRITLATAWPPDTGLRLSRGDFDSWSAQYPQGALVLMGNLAQVGTRRLAATTRQLRAVLE